MPPGLKASQLAADAASVVAQLRRAVFFVACEGEWLYVKLPQPQVKRGVVFVRPPRCGRRIKLSWQCRSQNAGVTVNLCRR